MQEGILAPVARLDRWLDGVLLVLLVTCSVRYLLRHDLDVTAVLVLGGALVLGAAYSTRRLVADREVWPMVWVGVVVVLWVALTLVAPSFAWTAVPVAFAVLQVLPFPYAVTLVVVMTAVVSAAWSRITDDLDPTVFVGPVGIALVTVLSYRALEREARTRQALIDELTEAQADLVAAQRRSGALAERTRLSREIHDSVGQGLSSITLLLGAAEQDWD
ncbi:MAG: sensor histidine kinase, partial [Dermatophilaceae bacterium]|nr:sensor histidine kinase [Dermatophilaceae bacterium]NUR16554.1 sensor histidine kinase [Dermatophilaceae bacterium]